MINFITDSYLLDEVCDSKVHHSLSFFHWIRLSRENLSRPRLHLIPSWKFREYFGNKVLHSSAPEIPYIV